jgi:hypothetical protein
MRGEVVRWPARQGKIGAIPRLLQIAWESRGADVACNKTLAVTDVTTDEMIEGVEFARAPAFLGFARGADVPSFV